MPPTFSIMTPVFNGGDFVRRAYSMLALQIFTDWEWVVVDDGSTDATADIVRSIADDRIRFISYKPNRGRGYARTQALEAAGGDWVVAWDVDDLYFPDRLTEIALARREGYEFCCSYVVLVDNDLRIKGVRGFLPAAGILPRFFVHHTLGCRLDLARRIGYDPACRAGEDARLVIALSANHRGKFIPEALTIYQEEREVNLSKAVCSNRSQFAHIRSLYRNGLLPAGRRDYWRFCFKWGAKLLALNSLRVAPALYRQSLRRRSDGDTQPGWQLSAARRRFIDQVRAGVCEDELAWQWGCSHAA